MVESNKFYELENQVLKLKGQINALNAEVAKLRRGITHPITVGYINKRLSEIAVVVKTDTGSPINPYEGMTEINTFDNKIRMYADGAWRQLATW